jgi:hypothetical protein
MGSLYSGNPAAFPTNITIPSDGDHVAASSFDAAYEGLADRTAWLEAHALSGILTEFTADGTLAIPADALPFALVEGCGGGGGGGGGHGGDDATVQATGGGGGSGAVWSSAAILITPGNTLTIDVGAGGAGGTSGADGTSGSDSTVKDGGTTLATFMGGGKGLTGQPVTIATTNARFYGAGGTPGRMTSTTPLEGWEASGVTNLAIRNGAMVHAPQTGSAGTVGKDSLTQRGMSSPQGYFGGTHGTNDSTEDSGYGGGGGGGGGAGPRGNGGNGGTGGPPPDFNGSAGTSAAANSGAGGGGGGAAATGPAETGTGGAGGAGGSGFVRVLYFRKGES